MQLFVTVREYAVPTRSTKRLEETSGYSVAVSKVAVITGESKHTACILLCLMSIC